MLSAPDFEQKTIVIVFANEGQKVSIKNDNLLISDEEGKVLLQNTCYRTMALWIVGNATITTGIMQRAKRFAFPIHILNHNFRLIGLWSAAVEGNFMLRTLQYTTEPMPIAKRIIHNKINNQLHTLKSIRSKNTMQKSAVSILEKSLHNAALAECRQTLLGIEGSASRVYFEAWYWDMDWKGRQPRAKRDILNVLLDIGYTYVYYLIENMLQLYGFDVYKGVLHTNFYQRKSLVCDIQEPFRCIIDKAMKKAYNLGQIKQEDFDEKNGQYSLKLNKNKVYTSLMLKAVLTYKMDMFYYVQQYYRAYVREKPIEEYPYFNMGDELPF